MEYVKEAVHRRLFSHNSQSILIDSLLRRIVNSKRLLADHIEVLEHTQAIPSPHIASSSHKKYAFTFMGGLALSSLALISLKSNTNCLRILAPTAATAYAVYLTVEAISVIKNRLSQRRLNETILGIEQTDAAIRKTISYFREAKMLCGGGDGDTSALDRGKRSEIRLKAISEIIQMIYAEVKMLESIALPEHIESMYEPLEELSTCIYFQKNIVDFTNDDIKAFYNIFLYFQSQYLTRLYLIIFYAQQCGLKYVNGENARWRKNLKLNTDKLSIWLDESMQAITSNKSDLHRLDSIKGSINEDVDSIDLMKMRRSSMDILCRLIAITNQYQSTDQSIQSLDNSQMNENEMLNISNEMQRVKESIVACQDDFKTLQLIYNKWVGRKFQLPVERVTEIAEQPVNVTNDLKQDNETDAIHIEDESKEYFAMRDIKTNEDSESEGEVEGERKPNKISWYSELDNIDMKVTRSFFAPVLKQLKTKIDPIKSEMKERELKFLMSKGIDREKIMEFDRNEDHDIYKSDSDSDAESNASNKIRSKPRPNRFDEMRSFLEQKQPISFMPFAHLPLPSSSEDVLE